VKRAAFGAIYGSIVDKKIADFENAFKGLQSILTSRGVLGTELTAVRTLKIVEKIEGKVDDIRQLHLFCTLPASSVSQTIKVRRHTSINLIALATQV
jgi:hypothetical protein